jgi:hypothetical protein
MSEEEPPPIGGSWSVLYAAVLAFHALVIAALALLSAIG